MAIGAKKFYVNFMYPNMDLKDMTIGAEVYADNKYSAILVAYRNIKNELNLQVEDVLSVREVKQ